MTKSSSTLLSAPAESMLFRGTASIAVIATLATSLSGPELINLYFLAGILLVLGYLLCTAIIQRKHKDRENLAQVLSYIDHLDALALGAFIALIDFSLVPTGLFFLMVQYRALSTGGAKRWMQNNLAFICGILLVFVFKQPTLEVQLSSEVNTVTLIVVSLYSRIIRLCRGLKRCR